MRIVLIIISVLAMVLLGGLFFTFNKSEKIQTVALVSPGPSAVPTDTPFTSYTKPVLEKSDRHHIYLIGDSMTHAFGPRGGIFTELLSKEFPETNFEVSNYAEANQSIIHLPNRLKEEVQADHDLLLDPILSGDPNPHLIIIESFGYNPLSQLDREEGLKKQEKVLTEVMTTLTNRFPDAVIMFLATIAPDKKTYGMSVTDSDANGRWAQAEERIEFITNHIDFANRHNIPLINTYSQSLDSSGDGDTIYINPDDDIHPSAEGLAHMARIMVQRIIEEEIFP